MITATCKGKYYDVEYSVVNVSELEGELRIDAEYYDPFYLKIIAKLKKKGGIYLSDSKFFIKRGTQPKYIANYTKYLALNSVHILEGDIDFENAKYISEEFYVNKQQYTFQYKDILVNSTGVGTLGRVAYVYDKTKKGIVDNHITRIRIKENNSLVFPEYLFCFLRSKYGQIQIERLFHGSSGQIEIYPSDFNNLFVSMPSQNFQKFIERLVLKAYEERQKAEQLYKQAEEILLEELGLKNWKPKIKKIKIDGQEFEEEENISIRMLSEVVKADRMDAEYWEPKYDEIEGLIKNYKNGWDYLPNLVNISKKKIKVNKEEVYNYIELADINQNLGVVNQTKQIKGEDLPSRARMKVKKGHVIMSSVEGSIDKIALINFEKNNLVASTGFFVFEEKQLNKETLLVLLKILSKRYLIREAQGTILTAIPYDSLKRIKLPKINQQIQQKISQLIQQSFEARENSKKLLEIAKRTVEIYIERDETKGLNYAKNELKQLHVNID